MDYNFLTQTKLFAGFTENEIKKILSAIKHNVRTYNKGEYVYTHGKVVQDICVILSGSIQVENTDVLGNKSILAILETGDNFAESYACIPDQIMLVDAVTIEKSEILFINIPSLFSEINSNEYESKLILNLLRTNSRKTLLLSTRIFHSSPKTIRGRLYSYFSQQISLQGTNHITIPLNRQQLADYLGVERTALSKELGKLKKEGLLTFHKNEFHLLIH